MEVPTISKIIQIKSDVKAIVQSCSCTRHWLISAQIQPLVQETETTGSQKVARVFLRNFTSCLLFFFPCALFLGVYCCLQSQDTAVDGSFGLTYVTGFWKSCKLRSQIPAILFELEVISHHSFSKFQYQTTRCHYICALHYPIQLLISNVSESLKDKSPQGRDQSNLDGYCICSCTELTSCLIFTTHLLLTHLLEQDERIT